MSERVPMRPVNISERKVLQQLPTYNPETRNCRGYVGLKYVNESVELGPSQFPVHLLEIDLKIPNDKNYCLSRYGIVDDKDNTVKYSLAGSHIEPTSKTSFEFHPADGTPLMVWAGNYKAKTAWVKTLERVISVANERERLLKNMMYQQDIYEMTKNSEDFVANITPSGEIEQRGGVYSKIDKIINLIRAEATSSASGTICKSEKSVVVRDLHDVMKQQKSEESEDSDDSQDSQEE